jgi:hypothetical protein
MEERRLKALWNSVQENKLRIQMFGGWKKSHNEELYDSYASSDIIRLIKSR